MSLLPQINISPTLYSTRTTSVDIVCTIRTMSISYIILILWCMYIHKLNLRRVHSQNIIILDNVEGVHVFSYYNFNLKCYIIIITQYLYGTFKQRAIIFLFRKKSYRYTENLFSFYFIFFFLVVIRQKKIKVLPLLPPQVFFFTISTPPNFFY